MRQCVEGMFSRATGSHDQLPFGAVPVLFYSIAHVYKLCALVIYMLKVTVLLKFAASRTLHM